MLIMLQLQPMYSSLDILVNITNVTEMSKEYVCAGIKYVLNLTVIFIALTKNTIFSLHDIGFGWM